MDRGGTSELEQALKTVALLNEENRKLQQALRQATEKLDQEIKNAYERGALSG